MNKKVFLAFSNAADQEDLIYIRSFFKKYDVEVRQFENGDFSKEQMLKCDYVFLIVPRQKLTNYNGIFVGRGQYDQVDYLHQNEYLNKVIIFISDKDGDNKSFYKIKMFMTNDTQDYKLKYGELRLGNRCREEKFDIAMQSTLGINKKPTSDESLTEQKTKNIKDWML